MFKMFVTVDNINTWYLLSVKWPISSVCPATSKARFLMI